MRREVLVLLDTSSLMASYQTGIDLLGFAMEMLSGKVRFIVADETVRELRVLSRSKKRSVKRAALLAMELTKGMDIIDCPGKVGDSAIESIAKRKKVVVATCDNELRKRLRRSGVPVISPRLGKRAGIEGLAEAL